MELVDTNVLIDLFRASPNPGVAVWARRSAADIAVSVVTIDELIFRFEIGRASSRRIEFESFLEKSCTILPITEAVAREAGRLRAEFRGRGETRSQADMMIAATGVIHGLTVVTRNTRDFEDCGVSVFNPFDGI